MADNVNESKNPAAVALGRLGGLKGGKARPERPSSTKKGNLLPLALAQL